MADLLGKLGGALDTVSGIKETADTLKTLGKSLKPSKPGEANPYDVETITRRNGLGTVHSAVTAMFYGHNHAGVGTMVPANNENHGYTFFTRPRLNLSYDNIMMERTFVAMNTANKNSIPAAVRALLDPVGQYGFLSYAKQNKQNQREAMASYEGTHGSPLVDPKQAFIPLLGNTLISMSGWPDPYMDTYTTKQGLYREEWAMVDSPSKIYNTFDLSTNFRNVSGDPVGYLIHVWTQYASLVREGALYPYPEAIMENFIDYNTRIYRLIMDPSRTFVLKIASCGAAFPTSNSVGSAHDYAEDAPYSRDRDQISVSWKCVGARYYDPMTIRAFNATAAIFCSDIRSVFKAVTSRYQKHEDISPSVRMETETMIKLTPAERPLFKNLGYPVINAFTSELMWWVYKSDYEAVMGSKPKNPLAFDADAVSKELSASLTDGTWTK